MLHVEFEWDVWIESTAKFDVRWYLKHGYHGLNLWSPLITCPEDCSWPRWQSKDWQLAKSRATKAIPATVVLRSYTFLPLHHLESLFIFAYPSLIRTVHGESYACWDGIEDITCYFDVNLTQSKKDMSPCLYILFHHFSWNQLIISCILSVEEGHFLSRCQIWHRSRRSVLALTSVVQSCQLCQHGAFDVQCDPWSAQFASYSLTTHSNSDGDIMSRNTVLVFKNSHPPTFEAHVCLSYFEPLAIHSRSHGFTEAVARGLRSGFLGVEDYRRLGTCDTLEDMRSALEETDYGTFLQERKNLEDRGRPCGLE